MNIKLNYIWSSFYGAISGIPTFLIGLIFLPSNIHVLQFSLSDLAHGGTVAFGDLVGMTCNSFAFRNAQLHKVIGFLYFQIVVCVLYDIIFAGYEFSILEILGMIVIVCSVLTTQIEHNVIKKP